MAIKRITVSVPAEIAIRIKRAAGRTRSVSEWVTNAVTQTLEEEDLRRRFLEFCDSVEATAAEERQAKDAFKRIAQGPHARRTRGVARRGKSAA